MKKETVSGIGSIVLSLISASCCIGPAVFVIFGTSIGFLGRLSFLASLKPYLLGFASLMLAYSFIRLYLRGPDCACREGIRSRRIARGIFWVGLMAFIFAILFPKIVLLIYG
jgi:hypothetical protein